MSEEPVEGQPDSDTNDSGPGKSASKDGGHPSPVEDFIGLIVPEPELLEEETARDPDVEPRVTGS